MFSNATSTVDIFIVIANSIITVGCPITSEACCAMSSGYTIYGSGCKGFNDSGIIWCNEIIIKMIKKTMATQERKSFFGIWYCRGYLHMIPVKLQIIMDDPNDFLSLSLCIQPPPCDRLTKQ